MCSDLSWASLGACGSAWGHGNGAKAWAHQGGRAVGAALGRWGRPPLRGGFPRCSRQAGAAQTHFVRFALCVQTCAASQMTKARRARLPAWCCAPRRSHKAQRCAHSAPALEVAAVVSPLIRFAVAGAARCGRLLRWPWNRFGGQARVRALAYTCSRGLSERSARRARSEFPRAGPRACAMAESAQPTAAVEPEPGSACHGMGRAVACPGEHRSDGHDHTGRRIPRARLNPLRTSATPAAPIAHPMTLFEPIP